MATIALGFGAVGVVFSAVDGVLLKPLPFADLDRLVTIWQTKPSAGVAQDDLAVATFLDLEEQARSFDLVAAANPWGVAFRDADVTEQLEAWTVTERFFELVGTRPLLGRTTRRTVVGVVNDTRHAGLEQPPEAGVFVPFAQQPIASRMTALGAGVGLVASAVAMRALDAFLYGVATLDPAGVGQATATDHRSTNTRKPP